MSDDARINELVNKALVASVGPLTAAIKEIVEEAFHAGEEAARQRILAAIGVAAAPSSHTPPVMITSPPASRPDTQSTRAPRGLTKEVVIRILTAHPSGLPLEEVQRMALEEDRRLVEKTVYNELMRGRRDEYRVHGGRWHLASSLPNLRPGPEDLSMEDMMR